MVVRTPRRHRRQPAEGSSAPAHRLPAEQRIYDYLVGVLRLSPGAAAGVLGNFKVESGFNPRAYNPGENAHGLAQWEGGRWPALQQYARAHHLGATSLPAELGFLRLELTHGYRGTLDELRSTSDPTTAAHYFQRDFEGSTIDSLPDRERYARQIFAQIREGRPLTGGPVGTHTAGGRPLSGRRAGSSSAGFGAAFDPLGIGGAASSIKGALVAAARGIERWALSFLLVIAGLAAIIVAFVLFTKGAEATERDEEKTGDEGGDLEQTVESDAGEKTGEGSGAEKTEASSSA